MNFLEVCRRCVEEICCARVHSQSATEVDGQQGETTAKNGYWVTRFVEKGQLTDRHSRGLTSYETTTKYTATTEIKTLKKPSCEF